MLRALVVPLVVLGLSACSGGDDGREAAVARSDAARTTAERAVPLITEAVMAPATTGSGRFVICGMAPKPSGVRYQIDAVVQNANLGLSGYPDAITGALEGDGWAVSSATEDALDATRDGIDLRATYGPGGLQLIFKTSCTDTSGDVLDELTDQAKDELTF